MMNPECLAFYSLKFGLFLFLKNIQVETKVMCQTPIHIYPHKPWRKIEVTICKIPRLTAHFMCGLMSDLLICTCL